MATEVKLPEFKDDMCGEVRKLGTLPISRTANDRLKRMLRSIRPVDPKMWVEFEHDPGPIKIKDQDGYGACNGHACATSAEWSRKSSRMTHVDLSAWYPYSIMCNGVDQGSMIDQALTVAMQNGIAPESEVKYGIIDPRQLTSAAHLAAKDFRVEAGEAIANFDEMMSATQRFLFGDFSVRVGANFNDLDEEGVCVRAGHHCARPAHARFGVQSSTRMSSYLYTEPREIDALVEALEYTRSYFKLD